MPHSSDRVRPEQLTPLFVLLALIHAASVTTRLDLVGAALPQVAHGAVFCAQLPLLLVGGYYESRLDHGRSTPGLPVWMQIRSRPVKWSLTLAFTYLSILLVQTFDLTIGPIDPSPPGEWPPLQRVLWFFGFSFGMYFANYLATTSFVVPVLRAIGKLLRRLPVPLTLLLLAALGLGLDLAILTAAERHLERTVELQGYLGALTAQPTLAAALVGAAIVLPCALASLVGPGKADSQN